MPSVSVLSGVMDIVIHSLRLSATSTLPLQTLLLQTAFDRFQGCLKQHQAKLVNQTLSNYRQYISNFRGFRLTLVSSVVTQIVTVIFVLIVINITDFRFIY